MKLILMLIEPVAWLCSRKSSVALANKLTRGGGAFTCISEIPVRRFSLARQFACSFLVATISVCMLSDASAQGVGFNSPSGTDGNTIYEDQFDSGTVGAKFVVFHANRFSSWDTSKVRLQNAPTGLTIAGGRTFREFGSTRSCSYQFHRRCIEIDLGWSSTADVTTDTTVTVQVHYDMFLNKYVLSSGWNDVATFTIKAVVEELQVSTPTSSSTVTEAGSKSEFTVRLGKAPTAKVTVNVSSSDTSEGSVSPGELVFTSDDYNTTQSVTITGVDDSIYDGSQSWNVVLNPSSSDTGYNALSDVNVAMTTTDNEDAPTFSINSPSVTEGDTGSVNLTFTVTLSAASALQHKVNYADAGTGTATSGTDYTAITGSTLTFAAGETSKTITVPVRGDTAVEANETVVISLSNATGGAGITTASGTGTITDDDLKFSIDSPSLTEGDSGSVNLVFTVTLNAAVSSQHTVDYADAGTGTATSGTDYTAITGSTLTFAANETSKTITVSVTGDTAAEGNETVVISLSNATGGAGIATASGTGTIIDNDLTFSIDSPSVTEGDSSSVNLVFTVTLSASVSSTHSVAYADAGTGTATSVTDYTSVTGGTLTFAANETSKTITISVTGDTANEGNETVIVELSNATTGISTATGTGTITDDDLVFSIDSPSVAEGDSSSVNLTFTVTLSASVSATHTVSYAQTGGTATSGTDYTSVAGGTLTFAANETSKTIAVSVSGDTVDEGTGETVVISLSNATTGISTASGTGTIRDDDPKFSIDSPSVTEGDGSSVNLVFTVTLSASSMSQYTVDYADAGTGTATSGTDYTAVTANTLTFAAGVTSQTITVSVRGDTAGETSETVVITLSNATGGAGISTASGTGTILDNDLAFSIDSPSVVEGDGGSVDLVFTVTLSTSSASQQTVDYADAGTGTATSGTDYTAVTANTLTFAANETSKTITVRVTGDTLDEGNETVVISLSNATAGISTASGTGTITDDDLVFSIDSPSVTEGDSGSVNLVFTVTLSASVSSTHTVDWAEGTGGTATSETDYTAISGTTLTFAPNTTTRTITVSVTGDTAQEGNETVVIELSNATTGISTSTGTGTIRDNDLTFSIADTSLTEGDSGSADMTFTVTLSASSTSQHTVDWAEGTGGTATSGTDYTAVSGGTLTFASGITSQTITVSIRGDTDDEGAGETVVIALSNASTGISTASGTGTIVDDDPKFSIASTSVTEGDSGPASMTFTVTLSASSSTQYTVDYAEGTGSTATSGTDFTAVSAATLTFAPTETSKTFTVSVTGDTDDEGASETVVIALSNATGGAGISTASGTGTILDDDPKFSIADTSVTEDDSNSVNLVFTVTLSASSSTQYTVDYAQTGGTATSGTDYTAVTASTLTFAPNATSQTITVSVTGDTLDEGNETVVIELSNAAGGAGISTASGTGTIVDNDLTFSIDSPSVDEGDSNSVNLVFTVTLSASVSSTHTVNYASSAGTATSGTDYTAVSGTLTFAANETTQTIAVSVTGDTTNEGNETVVVTLSGGTTGISTATGTGTIVDNDLTFSIADTSVAEGDSGSASLTFTVTLSAADSSKTHTVDWAEGSGGTATSGTDYTAVSGGTLTFASGTTSQTITVQARGDTEDEGAGETVVIALSNASTGISTASGTGTIMDDDPKFSINSPSVTEGDSSSVNLVFTVTLSASSTTQYTVDYAEGTGSTAASGTDFTAVTAGTLTFAPTETSKTVTVSVTGDTDDEGASETVAIALSNATGGAGISTASGTGTILDDDPKFSIADASVTEGDGSSVNLVFTVTLSASSSTQYTVDYAQTGGTATSGSDYTAVAAGTLTFAPNATTQTITVPVTGDTLDEGNETVVVELSNAAGGAGISTASGTGTIVDNDLTFSIDSPSVDEGDSSTVNLTFTVTLSAAVSSTHTVAYASSDGTATAGTDYTAVSGTLMFAANETSKTITVSVTGDTLNEGNETVVVTLSDGTTGISTATGTGTIVDDDLTFSIDSPSVDEVDSGQATLTFTVTLSAADSSKTHTVDYASSDGTATAVSDYTAVSGTLTFAPNATTQTITVSVTGDTLNEGNETVVVTLSNGSTGISTASGTGTIVDNNLTFSIDSPGVDEGDSSSVNLTFTVTLSAADSSKTHTVEYASSNGTATAGSDYTAVSGTLTFAANETSKTIAVSVSGDTTDEDNETLSIALSNATTGISTASGTGTIRDDDPKFSIADTSVTEGDTSPVNLVFTVTLSASSTSQLTVDYAQTGGTATSGTDYTAVTAGTLTFSAGDVSKTITVSVTGDTLGEPNETVVVTLSNASTGTGISTASGTGTIVDNDLVFSIDSPSVVEGNSGFASLTFTVTLGVSSTSQHTVDWAEGTGGTATSGDDYTAISGGTLTFAPSVTSRTITVQVRGDTLDEGNETVVIELSSPSAGTAISTSTGTGTIRDDDLTFSIDSPFVTEGDSGSVNLVFTVTLSASISSQHTVDYSQMGGTASSGTDYTAVADGTLTFASGTTTRTITVSVTGDTTQEGNETVVIELSNATTGIETSTGTGTIRDNDLTFSINSPSVAEGDSSTADLEFTVTLSASASASHTVDWAQTGGTATSGTDYTAVAGGTLTFAAGTTTRTITVSVTGDTEDEGAGETVAITLSNATTGILTATGTGTIADDDPKFSIDSPSVTEGDSSSASMTFTVTLSASSSTQYTVDYADAGSGTATSGGTDYASISGGTLTFAPTETSKTITVSVAGDTVDEGAGETVVVALSNATGGAGISTASGTGTIRDDDPKFSIDSPSVVEGDSGSVDMTFTVTLSASSSTQYTVDYAQTGGTATSGSDYTAIPADTLTFAATETSKTITVSVTGDTANEGNETVVVTLSNAAGGAGISTATGTGTITDNELAFSIDSPSVAEGNSGSVNLVFTVTLSSSVLTTQTVDYARTGGTATSGTDYTAVTGGTLTFPSGTATRTITVSVTGDTANEGNETVVITLSNATTSISTATGTGTIIDNDLTFSINSPSVAEGDSGSVNLVFTVTLSASSTSAHTVAYADARTGTATSGTDYTAIAGGTLTFAAGTTSRTITVSVTGDTAIEGSETVVIMLSSATTGILTATGTGTITDNDLNFSIDSPSVVEGDSGPASLVFTVTLSAAVSSSTHTVDWAEGTGGTATSGTDYASITGGTLTFAANETTKQITVSVTGDTDDEGTGETVVIMLSNASTSISTATGTGTITDDDPKFSIADASVAEGDSSSVNMTFTVTLSTTTATQTTVSYATSNGTATTADSDYMAKNGTLTFAASTTTLSQTFTVSVTGDTRDEGANETFTVSLSTATGGAGIGDGTATGTITDDDPNFSIDSPTVTEGDGGSVNLDFTVTLSASSTSQYTVDYAQTGGTATSGTDYTAVAASTLAFPVGTTSRTIRVAVTGDTANEANETVIITLSNASAGTGIMTATGTGTITDNDTPGFSIDSPSVDEGDSSTTNLTFTVTLSPAPAAAATVNWAVTGGTATSGTDFTATSGGTLTFAATETSKMFTVTVSGDTMYEPDETVVVTLSNQSTGTNISTASGTGTITNDDPGLSIDSPSVTEGDSGSVNLVFTVTMSPASSSQVTVNYAEGTGGTATSGTDFTALAASTTLTFAANETSKTIAVSVTGDTMNEPDETVIVTLSSASGADIVTASGTGTIRDNDTPGFSIDSPSVSEGDSGSVNLTFTVSLSPASYQATTVNYAVTGGTATSGTDFTALAAGTLTFAIGDTSDTITVSVTGDFANEPDETVVVTLSNATGGASISTASGTGTITNDDPGISIADATVEEGDEDETTTLTFTVTLSPAPTGQVTVDYADAGTGTAESGVDYTALAAGTLTFAANEASKTIEVSVIGDILSEPDETVVVALSNPNPSYTLVDDSATGTIANDDSVIEDELDMEIVAEVAREVTTSVVTAVSSRVASVVGGAAVAPPVAAPPLDVPPVNVPSTGVPSTGGFADSGLLSILARSVRHDRERDRGLEHSEMSLYRSLDGASFAYSPSALSANGSAGASGGRSGILTVWGSVDYRKLSGGGEGALTWDGELASLNIGTDTLSESGVLVGVAIGASKGSFGYQDSIGGSSGVLKIRVKTLNPYVGWSVSDSASLWASVGYGRGKINYNDEDAESSSSKMKLASAAFGGRYRLFSSDGSADDRLVQVDLKGEAWGLRNKVEGNDSRPMGSRSRAHGMRLAVERHRSGMLESGASLVLSGEAGVRWDGGDGDTGTGFEMGGTANYSDSATGMKVVATTRILVDHESNRKEWGAGLTVGCQVDSRETGMTYRSSLSHGKAKSGVDSLWDSSAASRASSEENSLATRLDAEVGYRMYGASGLHTPYVGFGAEAGSRRDYRLGMRYAGGSAISSGLEFERREAGSKRPDHRVMLKGQMNW